MAGGELILLIEDDPDIRESIVDILEDESFRVATAVDGEDGLERLRSGEAPDLILLDLLMPRMDARAFRKEQLRVPAWAAIPTVIMSADLRAEEKARELSAAAGVSKPVEIDALLAVMRAALDGRTIP